jgi:hypothetical protein
VGSGCSFYEETVPWDIKCSILFITVPGHKSELAFGLLGPEDHGVPVVAMLGRARSILFILDIFHNNILHFQFHPYEGHTLASVVYPIRVMAKLGVKHILSELLCLFYSSTNSR